MGFASAEMNGIPVRGRLQIPEPMPVAQVTGKELET